MTSFEIFNCENNICTPQGLRTGPQLIITYALVTWSHFKVIKSQQNLQKLEQNKVAHCDTLFSCALEIFLLTDLLAN